jgi:hypothetical protein
MIGRTLAKAPPDGYTLLAVGSVLIAMESEMSRMGKLIKDARLRSP